MAEQPFEPDAPQHSGALVPSGTENLCPAARALMREVDVILALAKELQADGRHGDALAVALVGAQRLRAVRALQAMDAASRGVA